MENNEEDRNRPVNNKTTIPWVDDDTDQIFQSFLSPDEELPSFFGTAPNGYQILPPANAATSNAAAANNNHFLRASNNPSSVDPLRDFALMSAFNGLSLSSDPREASLRSFINNGGVGPSNSTPINNAGPSLPYDPQQMSPLLSFDEVQRIRAQSAARNHMEMMFGPFNSHLINQYDNLNNGFSANYLNGPAHQATNPFYESSYGGHGLRNPRRTGLNENASVYVPIGSNSRRFHSNYGFVNNNGLNRGNRGRYRGNRIGGSNGGSSNGSYGPRSRFDFTSLNALKGRIQLVTRDRDGCRFLHQKIEEGSLGDFRAIFAELKDHVCELMVNPFASHLFGALVRSCDEEEISQLLLVVVADVMRLEGICIDCQGTRAMQKLIENMTTPNQRRHLVSALASIGLTLMKNGSGYHVIECCFKFFPDEDIEQILDVVCDHCLEIATNKSGCCVLQSCIIPAATRLKEQIVAELTSLSLILSEDPYANYVVQFILSLRMQRHTSDVLRELSGSYVSLSMNKHGSNVVEKCLQHSSSDQRAAVVSELIGSPPMFLEFVRHPFGNYVAQRIMEYTTGKTLCTFVKLILMNDRELHSHPHGKVVFVKALGLYHRLQLSSVVY